MKKSALLFGLGLCCALSVVAEGAKTLLEINEEHSAFDRQVNLNKQLVEAAFDGDLERVQELLGLGADINATAKPENSMFEITPLHAAVMGKAMTYCQPELIDLLISAEADVNAEYSELKWTPLQSASGSKYCSSIALSLINAGANVSAMNAMHTTPLLIAIGNGNTQLIEALIDAGADVNPQGLFTLDTPLYKTISEGYPEIARKLVKAGADVNKGGALVMGWDSSPLPKAIMMANAYLELIKELIEAEAEMNQQDSFTGSRVLDSVTDSRLREILVEAGAEEGEDKLALHTIERIELKPLPQLDAITWEHRLEYKPYQHERGFEHCSMIRADPVRPTLEEHLNRQGEDLRSLEEIADSIHPLVDQIDDTDHREIVASRFSDLHKTPRRFGAEDDSDTADR